MRITTVRDKPAPRPHTLFASRDVLRTGASPLGRTRGNLTVRQYPHNRLGRCCGGIGEENVSLRSPRPPHQTCSKWLPTCLMSN
jgi:hypothetical protein